MKKDADSAGRTAVLLINVGSPSAPNKEALRVYLKEFLSDSRVIDLSRWLWLPILHGIILNVRPKKSAHAYEQIWWDEGAPLLVITKRQADALREQLKSSGREDIIVDFAMRYGEPSIKAKIEELSKQGVERLLVIPMYPQYADATTASVFDGVAQALAKKRFIPELRFVRNWHDHPAYIDALAGSIRKHFAQHGQPDKLLISFHGEPKRYLKEGDPYFCHCHKTARLLVERLDLPEDRYELMFQSRFGPEEWLKPYADKRLAALPKEGVESVSVICPGFSADCLETLEEMAIRNRAVFIDNGGKSYDYIPCLNNDEAHIELLRELVLQHVKGWSDFSAEQCNDEQSIKAAHRRRAAWEKTHQIARD